MFRLDRPLLLHPGKKKISEEKEEEEEEAGGLNPNAPPTPLSSFACAEMISTEAVRSSDTKKKRRQGDDENLQKLRLHLQ